MSDNKIKNKEEGMRLFNEAITALFNLEQHIRLEEKANVNKPMYRIRIDLNEMKDIYKKDERTLCDYIVLRDLIANRGF